MTRKDVLKLVREGVRLDKKIKAISAAAKRLEEIKAQLRAHAAGEDLILTAGRCSAEVSFIRIPARRPDAVQLEKARAIAGNHFENLFCLGPIDGFTEKARAFLAEDSETLLEAVAPKSGRVSFKCLPTV